MSDIRSPLLKSAFDQTQTLYQNTTLAGIRGPRALSNGGAGGVITATLPKSQVGAEFWFRVVASHTFTVTAQSPDTIGTKGAGASYAASTPGNLMLVKCIVPGIWDLPINSGFV
jgi:hypothetical protein